MSETQGPTPNGEDKAQAQDPHVHTIVIQYNDQTMQSRVIFPPEVKDTCTLYGMIMMALQTVIQGQLVRDVTQGVMKALSEKMAIKGRGGISFPSPAQIEASRHH